MLSVADEHLRGLNPDARLILFGQEYNEQSYAICGSDMLIKGQNLDNIVYGDSFTRDGHAGRHFDYLLANPPFGVEWKPQADFIKREHDTLGPRGRFGAGLPRINDGSFLFLQHMISKMKPVAREGVDGQTIREMGGSRIAIVFNGSPLFTGDAGSGESNIRRWIIENDWLDAIVAMPDQLFYNTGISTYLWIVTNRKPSERRGKVQLINAADQHRKMRRSLGQKRNEITDDQVTEIVRLYNEFAEGERVRIFDNADFGYRKITVERPLRLNFAVTEERRARLWEQAAFLNLGGTVRERRREAAVADGAGDHAPNDDQAALLAILRGLPPTLWKDHAEFASALDGAARAARLTLSTPLKKAILAALGERDETAEICRNSNGHPEADPDLRDSENVPLGVNVDEYFAREVTPHVPNAWINRDQRDPLDGGVGRVGYEISFNRYFYHYQPPRPLEAIEADLKVLEREILNLLQEVAG